MYNRFQTIVKKKTSIYKGFRASAFSRQNRTGPGTLNEENTMIISPNQIRLISQARPGEKIEIEVDFGLATAPVRVEKGRAVVDNRYVIDLNTRIKDTFCYALRQEGLVPVAFFSPETNRFYKLIPTRDWPSFSIGSVPMHSITRSSPSQDTQRKISLLAPYGYVLDTCMGLGYTAISASRTSRKVITFEKDDNVRFLAELNPLSRELFSSPKIEMRSGDISRAISEFKAETFDCIVHDPPTFKIAPELFGSRFYGELKRVLKRGGKFYHYLPRYKIKKGYDFPEKIQKNCRKAGFIITYFSAEEGDLVCTI